MSKLKIAIQKSGRLKEDSLKVLAKCGIHIENEIDQLKVNAQNFPLEVYFLRNADIVRYLKDGVVDLGIVGENSLIEYQADLEVVCELGFSKCRVSMAVPKNVDVADLSYFEGKQIATSYPNTLQGFLTENQLSAGVHTISGSVEVAPNMGLADAVMDIVSSGNTLFKNGLKEVAVVLRSQAVLAQASTVSKVNLQRIETLRFRLNAVRKAQEFKYVLLNLPTTDIDRVSTILPFLKSPTVLPLAREGWSSLHSVIAENDFWNVIDQLKTAGAEDILVIPIEKMVN